MTANNKKGQATMSENPLLRYHPERYRRTRPFSYKVASSYRRTSGMNPPTKESFEDNINIVMKTYNDEIMCLPFESRPADGRLGMRETDMALYYGMYCAYGRNIFHLNDEILQEFLHTDVDAVPIGLIDFPYDCFYLSFGSIKELTLYHENCYVDGAYVFAFDGFPLQIALTTATSDWNYANRHEWILNPDRFYYMCIERDDPSATLGALINEALRNELESHKDPGVMPETGVYDVGEKSLGVINNRPESAKKDQEEIVSGFNTFRVALNLIVNALCYISQYKNEVKKSWPEGTPRALLSKLESAKTPKQKQRVVSKLASMGYTKINLCGSAFEKPELSGEGGETRPHWRRGHWRQQPYGEGLKERKIIWIRPTIVRKDKGSPASGHIYEMSKA